MVFQSYQDDEQMVMKGCVQWKPVYSWEDFASSWLKLGAARSVGQHLTHWAFTVGYKQSLSMTTTLTVKPATWFLVWTHPVMMIMRDKQFINPTMHDKVKGKT